MASVFSGVPGVPRHRGFRYGLAMTAAFSALAATAAADPLTEALGTPVTVTWAGLPLRTAAGRLGEAGGVAVVVDRRIDPDVRVSLDAVGEPLAEVVSRIAAAAGAEVAPYAGHVRIVPRGRGAAVAAAERVRERELRAVPRNLRAAVLAGGTASWAEGAVPGDVVASLADEAGIVIAGLDGLPHDHFPAGRLPPLPLAHRVDLLLAHFDRRVEWKPRQAPPKGGLVFRLVAIDDAAGATPPAPAVVKPPRPGTAAATYSLTVAAPLEELLATLARRFQLALAVDRPALARVGVAPGEIVRLELHDASREQMLDAILAPRGLGWRIEGDTLTVSAASR